MNEQTNATPAAATAQGSGPSQPTNTASSLGGDSGSAPAPTGASAVASAQSGTVTMTETETQAAAPPEVLSLTLSARPSVRWDEDVVNNEGMGRKSSKRCCIFHKQRAFGESSTESDYDSDKSGDGDGEGKKGKIARPKKSKEVPDFQRYHA